MGISLGSSSKKPYVGSKEVQEAYVGSQLVYKAVPPYVYGFLGRENDYIKADWVTLGDRVGISKYDNIYRINFGRNSSITIDLTEKKGSKINVAIANSGYTGNTSTLSGSFYDAKGNYVGYFLPSSVYITTSFTSYNKAIPSKATKLVISANFESSTTNWYADMIYQFD